MDTRHIYRHGYRPDIDGLRALAVLAVLLFHAQVPPFTGGFVGVDIFFVISGYLITRNILADIGRDCFSFATFFTRRVFRLLPASFVVIGLTTLAGWLILPSSILSNLGASASFALLSVSNLFFWRDVGYFALAAETRPLLHTWSLGVEEQFYLLYPPLLVALCFLLKGTWSRLGAVFVASMAATLVAEYLVSRGSTAAAFYLMPTRAGEFGIGVMAALLPGAGRLPQRAIELLYATGLVLIAVALLVFTRETPFPGWRALVPAIGAGLIIYAGGYSALSRVLRVAPAVGLGLISYSVYLVHWPLLVYADILEVQPHSLGGRLGLVLLCIGLAVPLYVYVERPFRLGAEAMPAALTRRRMKGIVAGLAACQLAAFGAWTGWTEAWRYSPEAHATIQAAQSAPGAECESGFNARTVLRCVSGPAGAGAKALLLGDSHSQHWRPALAAALPAIGYGMDHYEGCIPLPGLRKFMDGREDKDCRNYTSRLEQLVDDYDLVILAARWALYTETTIGAQEKGTLAKRYMLTGSADGEELTEQRSKAAFTEAVAKWLAHLERIGKRVLVLGQVPELGIDLTPCLGLPDWRGVLTLRLCRPFYDRAAALKRLAFTDAALQYAIDGRSRAALYLPSAQLCPEGQEHCKVRKSGVWLYRDDDHLNARGAATFTDEITAVLSRLSK